MTDPNITIHDEASRNRAALPIALGIGGYLALLLTGSLLGGELGQIALASLNALPFAGLAVLAYFAGREFNWAWIVSGLWLAFLAGGAGLVAFSTTAAVAMDLPANPQPGTIPVITSGAWLRLGVVSLLVLAGMIAGLLTLLPAVRARLARIIPIDPGSFVHAIALATVVMVTLICFAPLVVLGEPPLLAMIDQITAQSDQPGARDNAGMLRDQLYTLIWIIPAGILAVGYGVRRGLRESLDRLGLVRPTWRQVGAGVLIALLLVGAVQLLTLGINWLWGLFGWATTDSEAFAELLSFAINPIGAVVIGVSAGLGEELAVRGVLQPRLGILLSNFFFVSLHALQYSWDALLIVFLVGLACGLVRKHSNTSTAAIVHGVYNFTLVMLAVAGG